jgi:hypothetical protein
MALFSQAFLWLEMSIVDVGTLGPLVAGMQRYWMTRQERLKRMGKRKDRMRFPSDADSY